jgi:hypothetical protein
MHHVSSRPEPADPLPEGIRKAKQAATTAGTTRVRLAALIN